MVYISSNTTNIASYARLDTQSKIPATLNTNLKTLKDFKSDGSRSNDGVIISVGDSSKVAAQASFRHSNNEAKLKVNEWLTQRQHYLDHANQHLAYQAQAAQDGASNAKLHGLESPNGTIASSNDSQPAPQPAEGTSSGKAKV